MSLRQRGGRRQRWRRQAALDPADRLLVDGPRRRMVVSLAELAAMPLHSTTLPITCVEGWSADAEWTGVRIRDLLAEAGFDRDADVLVESLQRTGFYRRSVLPATRWDPLTLLAIEVNGQPLDLDYGFPCRLIAPNRPGVLQTKSARIQPRVVVVLAVTWLGVGLVAAVDRARRSTPKITTRP